MYPNGLVGATSAGDHHGKIIGAQSLITGDITVFSYQQSSVGGTASPIKIFEAKTDKVTAMVALGLLSGAVGGETHTIQRPRGENPVL